MGKDIGVTYLAKRIYYGLGIIGTGLAKQRTRLVLTLRLPRAVPGAAGSQYTALLAQGSPLIDKRRTQA